MARRPSRIVGLGSPFGDDRVGWDAVARLQELLPVGVVAEAAADPLAVADGAAEHRLLVVIDACRGAGPPGSVHRFEWPDRRLPPGGAVSSHGFGLAASLEFAGALGRLPPRVVVFAVEGISHGPAEGLSPDVASAIPEVVERVAAELATADGGHG